MGEKKSVVIVGGGVAGLSAGICALLAGYDCTILEKNKFVGGCLSGWDRQNYHIDNCMHWLTGTRKDTSLYRLWEKLGVLSEEVPLRQGECFFAVEGEGRRLSFLKDTEKTKRDMLALSPADTAEIEKFFAALTCMMERIPEQNGSFLRDMRTLGSLPALLPYVGLSLGALSNRFHHPLLRSALVDYIGAEFSVFALLFAYASFATGNGAIPAGGSLAMANRMAARFRALGGRLLTGKAATRIRVHGKKADAVITEGGDLYTADGIICACDPTVTYGRLLSYRMPEKCAAQYKKGLTYSAVQTAFSCDWEKPLFEGTLIFDAEPFFLAGKQRDKLAVREYSYEPEFAPVGKTVLQTLTFLRENEVKAFLAGFHSKEEYRQEKMRIGEVIGDRIARRFPSLKGSLRLLDVWTPLTYYRYFEAWDGAFLSFAMTPKEMFYRMPARVAPFSNLFLASQWQGSPGGIPTAARYGEKAVKELSRAVPVY